MPTTRPRTKPKAEVLPRLRHLTIREAKYAVSVAAGNTRGQAVLDAGYACPRKEASSVAGKLQKRPEVKAAIEALTIAESAAQLVTPPRIISRLAEIGLGDTDEVGGVKLKGSDRVKALETLGKWIGLGAVDAVAETSDAALRRLNDEELAREVAQMRSRIAQTIDAPPVRTNGHDTEAREIPAKHEE